VKRERKYFLPVGGCELKEVGQEIQCECSEEKILRVDCCELEEIIKNFVM